MNDKKKKKNYKIVDEKIEKIDKAKSKLKKRIITIKKRTDLPKKDKDLELRLLEIEYRTAQLQGLSSLIFRGQMHSNEIIEDNIDILGKMIQNLEGDKVSDEIKKQVEELSKHKKNLEWIDKYFKRGIGSIEKTP